MWSHKNRSKYRSNNPSHPLSTAIQSPSWPPHKAHAQKKQNGRNYIWFWLLHVQKEEQKAFSRRGQALLSHSRVPLWRLSLGRWNTNPGLGQMVAASFSYMIWCWQHRRSALAVPSAAVKGASSIPLASLQPPTAAERQQIKLSPLLSRERHRQLNLQQFPTRLAHLALQACKKNIWYTVF